MKNHPAVSLELLDESLHPHTSPLVGTLQRPESEVHVGPKGAASLHSGYGGERSREGVSRGRDAIGSGGEATFMYKGEEGPGSSPSLGGGVSKRQ